MARQIVILETIKAGDGVYQVTGFNWFPIAASNARVPRPGFRSAGSGLVSPKNITTAEQAALEDGSVLEEGFAIAFASSSTTAQIQADLVRRYNDRATAIAAQPATRQFYGIGFDGTSWS